MRGKGIVHTSMTSNRLGMAIMLHQQPSKYNQFQALALA